MICSLLLIIIRASPNVSAMTEAASCNHLQQRLLHLYLPYACDTVCHLRKVSAMSSKLARVNVPNLAFLELYTEQASQRKPRTR